MDTNKQKKYLPKLIDRYKKRATKLIVALASGLIYSTFELNCKQRKQ